MVLGLVLDYHECIGRAQEMGHTDIVEWLQKKFEST